MPTLLALHLITLLGSHMSSFAVAATLYTESRSASLYAASLLAGTLPFLLASPRAGRFVDQVGPVRALVISQAAGALCAVLSIFIWVYVPGHAWLLLASTALGSMAMALDFPAVSVLTTQLLDKQRLARVNGLLQVAGAAAQLLAPLTAALVLEVGLSWVFAIDAASFAVCSLVIARLRPGQTVADPPASRPVHTREGALGFAWSVVRASPLLIGLLGLAVITNLNLGVVQVGAGALILEQYGPAALSAVLTAGGVGMLVGGALLSIVGSPSRPWPLLLGLALLQACLVALIAVRPTVWAVAGGAAVVFASVALWNGVSQSTWQVLIPVSEQGRVFALRAAVARTTVVLANGTAGVAIDGLRKLDDGARGFGAAGLVLIATGALASVLVVLVAASTGLSAKPLFAKLREEGET